MYKCIYTDPQIFLHLLTYPSNRLNQQPLLLSVYGANAQKIINHFMQINRPGIFQHDNVMPHTMHK